MSQSDSDTGEKNSNDEKNLLKRALYQDLPLQDQTTFFILANVLDIVMTNFLIRSGAIESNPVAAYIYHNFGFNVLIAFKMLVVAFVCVIAQIVATKSKWKAKFLLNFGTIIVMAVVIYSISLTSKLPPQKDSDLGPQSRVVETAVL